MKILAIDSSGMVASVAVLTDTKLLGEYTINYKKTHSQTLLPMIDRVVSFLEMDLKEVDAIAVTTGPGSFTGLRIGVATAKGLAQALDKPIIEVPTLEGLAYNMCGLCNDGFVCSIMDARRNQVFTGIYYYEECDDKDNQYKKYTKQVVKMPACAMDIEELIEKINEMGQKVVFVGDGVDTFAQIIDSNIKVPYEISNVSIRQQKASSIGALAIEYMKEGKLSDASMVKPEYLRMSQAERQLKEKQLKENN